jgi:hypothetical protein
MRAPAVLAAAAVLWTALPAAASDSADPVTVTVHQSGGLSPEVQAVVERIAAREEANLVVFHAGTLQLLRVLRGESVVQAAPDGFRYPMATTAVDPHRVVRVVGGEVATALAAGEVVFGQASARLRGARAGDELELVGWDGSIHSLRVGAVVPDQNIRWAELAISDQVALSLGLIRPSSVLLWGFVDPSSVLATLERDLPADQPISVRHSGDEPDPDRVLPAALIKQRFGEFSYSPAGFGDQVVVDPAWEAQSIVWLELPVLGRFRCHRLLVPYLRGVVGDLQESGLIYHIDPDDFQRNGGCYNPRVMRGDDKGGALSRHAWGAAIDINPSRNPYGGHVAMNRRIVETFREWGFAWGGSWIYPDGAHFEWSHLPEFMLEP